MPPSLTIAAGGEERAFLGDPQGKDCPSLPLGNSSHARFFIYISRNVFFNFKLASGLYYSAREMATTEPNLGR